MLARPGSVSYHDDPCHGQLLCLVGRRRWSPSSRSRRKLPAGSVLCQPGPDAERSASPGNTSSFRSITRLTRGQLARGHAQRLADLRPRDARHQHPEDRLLGFIQPRRSMSAIGRDGLRQHAPATATARTASHSSEPRPPLLSTPSALRTAQHVARWSLANAEKMITRGGSANCFSRRQTHRPLRPPKVIIDDCDVDSPQLRLGDRTLSIDAHRLDAEVALPFQQLHEPQSNDWMIVHHHETNLTQRKLARAVVIEAGAFNWPGYGKHRSSFDLRSCSAGSHALNECGIG